MNLVDWAKEELDRLIEVDADGEDMQKAINKDILEVVKVFAGQGHSGFSAEYALSIIKRLLAYKPITPLTGEDDEWCEPYDGKTQQNKRCSSVFREDFDNSTAHDIDGRIFSDDGGKTWFSKGGRGGSSKPVTFPYVVPEKPERIILE